MSYHQFEPIKRPLGNPPVVASGRGQDDARPEVWSASEFFVIVEASPSPTFPPNAFQVQAGFQFNYIMSASIFYRISCCRHGLLNNPLFIFTQETSTMLPHESPGLFGMLMGESPKPREMVIGKFAPDMRMQLDTIPFDGDFSRGRERLLHLSGRAVGVSGGFQFGGYFEHGRQLPAMK